MPLSIARVLQHREDAAGRVKLAEYQRQSQRCNGCSTSSDNEGLSYQDVPWIHRLKSWFLFDCHYTLPSCFRLVITSTCHLAMYGVLEATSKMIYQRVFFHFMNLYVFHGCQVLLGLVLLRANGYLWQFLDKDAYKTLKFDMHNRFYLGFLDARVLAFFKDTVYHSATNTIGFCLVYVGLHRLSDQLYLDFMSSLDEWYLDTRDAIVEVQNFPKNSTVFYSWEGTSMYFSEAAQHTCLALKQYVEPTLLQGLFEYCCTDPFQDWIIFEMMYNILFLVIGASLGASIGINILQLYDEE